MLADRWVKGGGRKGGGIAGRRMIYELLRGGGDRGSQVGRRSNLFFQSLSLSLSLSLLPGCQCNVFSWPICAMQARSGITLISSASRDSETEFFNPASSGCGGCWCRLEEDGERVGEGYLDSRYVRIFFFLFSLSP